MQTSLNNAQMKQNNTLKSLCWWTMVTNRTSQKVANTNNFAMLINSSFFFISFLYDSIFSLIYYTDRAPSNIIAQTKTKNKNRKTKTNPNIAESRTIFVVLPYTALQTRTHKLFCPHTQKHKSRHKIRNVNVTSISRETKQIKSAPPPPTRNKLAELAKMQSSQIRFYRMQRSHQVIWRQQPHTIKQFKCILFV